MAAEGKTIIFYHCNVYISYFIISSAYMKDQPWDLNQTWPVGRKWCRFTTAPKNFGEEPPPNLGCKKHQILDHFFLDVRT